jgi:serine phosphatase RsbU (regulator of sigma subunit)
MEKRYKILFVEDVPSDVEFMERQLSRANIDFVSMRVDKEKDFLEALGNFSPDIIICDHSLPHFDSRIALEIMKETKQEIPFLLVTGTLSDEYAVECLKEGVFDYILKSNLARLPYVFNNALSKQNLVYENKIFEAKNQQIQKSNEEYTNKNKEMIDSINYAKEIQNAVLPKESYIQQFFSETFLINMPKDIVSGDFYWCSQSGSKFIVAVGDCTGHGVPAALISMMGYTKLNHIVNILGLTKPSHILEQLDVEIREAFKKEDNEHIIPDGMDIAICSIDRKNNTVEFSGANRPLYYLKNDNLEIIKGSKKSIGSISEDLDKDFKNHIISKDTMDSIYLFTDGFMDQFGGVQGKKFLCKRFRELLSSTHIYTMKEQKELLINALNEWKGEREQTDDICVLGIKFNHLSS